MITYKLWSEVDAVTSGDIVVYGNELWEATSNISPAYYGDKSNTPTFSPNWKKSNNTQYINVKYINHFIEVKIDTSVDDVTFILPDPSLNNRKDIHVALNTSGNTLTIETNTPTVKINNSITSMDFNVSADSIVLHPSSDINYQIRSEVADKPPLVFCCRPGSTQSFTTTLTNINYDTILLDKGSFAHLSSGEIYFDIGGIYNISVSYGGRVTNNSRTEVNGYLQINKGSGFVNVPDLQLNAYHRHISQGADGDSQTISLEIEAGDIIRVQVVGDGGSIETIPASCTINITVSKGLRGEKGEKGEQGFDGADGDITWEGGWTAGTYQENMAVEYNGSSFVCIQNGTNINPGTPDTPNSGWELLAKKGSDGSGATINVSEDGTMATNTPHGTLNFKKGVIISDAGGGVADINIVNVQPYIGNNDDVLLFINVTGDIFIAGDNFDNNMSVDLGSDVTVNYIEALTPNNLKINYTTSSSIQSAVNIEFTRNGIPSFGHTITCTVTDVIIGNGVAGTWVENFNTSSWSTPRWNVVEGSSLTNFFHTGVSTPSGNTGATSAYDGNFLYGERSNPNNGVGSSYNAYAETSDFHDLTQVSFMLHKWSSTPSNMGDLVIYSQNSNNTWTERWRHTGNEQTAQGDAFVQITLNAIPWDCKGIRIMFEAVSSYMSDICIDDVEIISI